MKPKPLFPSFLWFHLSALFALLFAQVSTTDTKFLTQPAISKTRIAFIYCGDLWTADHRGQNVQRLTSDQGVESNPDSHRTVFALLLVRNTTATRTFIPFLLPEVCQNG